MAKRIITDIVQAHAVALCRRGANPQAHVLLRKTADTPSSSNSEEPEMSIKSILAFHALSDVAKAHVTALAETDATAADAFLAKSADEQKSELEKAGKKDMPKDMTDDDKKKAADAKKTGGDAADDAGDEVNKGVITAAELTKSIQAAIAPLVSQIETLKSAGVESELRKAAMAPEYAGYPGGADEVYKSLKAVEGQPEAVQELVKSAIKDRATIGKAASTFNGLHLVSSPTPDSAADIEKKAEEIVKADTTGQTTIDQARLQVMSNDALLMKALEDEDAA